MHRLVAGLTLVCGTLVSSLAEAQRIPEPSGVSRAQAARVLKSTRRRAIDRPPRQVVIESKFLEVNGEFRHFINWDKVSGDDPAVTSNVTTPNAWGININLGYELGSLPLWVQAGGYYSTGLKTDATFEDGEKVHGEVDSYGAGIGARLVPITTARLALYLWAMGYYDWDDGNFDIIDGAVRKENRVHRSWTGDYGLGAVYLIEEVLGINFGISYSGIFDKKNADENLRFKIGLLLNPPPDVFY
jgi:hypothetical protein